MDITGAYLNGHLKEEIYMRQPTGFDDSSGRVCRLLRTLYGLKQSGREWNNRLNDHLSTNLVTLASTTSTTAFTFDSAAILSSSLLYGWTISYSSAPLLILSHREERNHRPNSKQPIRATLDSYSESKSTAIATVREIKISQGQFLRKVLISLRDG